MVKSKDLQKEILEFLRESDLGMSLTKIAEKIESHRTTAKKYLTQLEGENKVFKQNVGVYKLWFHKKKIDEEEDKKKSLSQFYEPLYYSLLKNFKKVSISNDQIKELGKLMSKDLNLSDPSVENQIRSKGEKSPLENIAEFTKDALNYVLKTFDNCTWDEYIITNTDTILLRMKNSTFSEFPSHFYLLSGIVEVEMREIIKKYLKNKTVSFNVFYINEKEKFVDFELILD
ncbi:MAG: hypothetical protein GY870_07420 [archaeon]|nr:hypothetical protein [archaeon]